MTQLYTVSEVAKMLHVKKNYIYELVYTGQLEAIRLSERRFRFSEEMIEKYLHRRRQSMQAASR